ncbi:8-oxo-dGTP pyrophosphatase MutT (NUDIX family) [Bacillus tianshenii]|uniref:8-oxo-dGTP pyrophosphatase MutT (NUDIX family) n=1 Tax=Sutcliffiella tianshenii TaxID=1463404 RepID=A0ABS2P2B3_9BACI|nr:NUDIX domain-containing protein [Bacillus tianshenii]MBM7621100.1 8-oxo-dGTP pyrophosphatase MutT (NUDIX family) [Bacillus tianshenii]
MYPRANTLGIIMKDNYILLEEQEGKHSKGIGSYYRPIGGTIEFGERSNETLVREFSEELGVEVVVRGYISCIENIFKIDEKVGHEITQIYLVDFKDTNLYQQEYFTVSEGNKITYAKWISKEEIFSGEKVLYPNGLTELLKEEI